MTKAFVIGALIIIVIFSWAASMDCYSDFCGDARWPMGISMAFALLSGLVWYKLWRYFTDTHHFFVNYFMNFFVVVSVMQAILLLANSSLPPRKSTEFDAGIERLYSEVHYKARRVAKNLYTKGAPYKVYKAQIHLPDGREKCIELPYSEYKILVKGDSILIKINVGALGWEYIEKM